MSKGILFFEVNVNGEKQIISSDITSIPDEAYKENIQYLKEKMKKNNEGLTGYLIMVPKRKENK